MYILIAIVFTAEIIIALNLIALLVKADRKICDLNDCVTVFNPLAQTCLQYVRCVVSSFNGTYGKVIKFIKKKQEQIVYKVIIMISVYAVLVLFKINRKKASKICGLIGAIRDAAIELMV